ncbi:MAG: DUF2249 domain-containing protein [Nibricoccus sp.]
MTTDLDLRGLEPPEPMMRVLETLGAASLGTQIRARLDRRPMFLIEELGRRGQTHQCNENPEGGWLLEIQVSAEPAP